MRVNANRQELLDVAARAATIAPTSSPVDILKGVLLETDGAAKLLTVMATNMEIALEQKLPCDTAEDDELVVNAKLFAGMLGQLEGETVELRRLPGSALLSVKGGRAEYTVPVFERKEFPHMEIPFPEDTITVTGIPSMAKRTVFAVSTKDTVPLMKCVNLMFTRDGLVAAGSDGVCLVTAKGDTKSTGDAHFLMPAHSLEKLARMSSDKDEYRVGTTGNDIVFSKPNLVYRARILEGDYINTQGIIGNLKNSFTVLSDMAELRETLHSVIAVDPEGPVKLGFNGSKLLFASDGVYGKASTEIDVTPLTGAPSGEYWFTAQRLYDSFRALSGTVTLGIAQNGMLTFSTEETFYMQTGVRPPAAKKETPAPKPRKKAA